MKEFEDLLIDFLPTDREVEEAIRSVPRHFSANTVIDLQGTALALPTIVSPYTTVTSGLASLYAASGATIGQSCDLINANTFCNLSVAGVLAYGSGQARIQVQSSDTDTSGTYTDPTSGLAQLPTYFESGGIVRLNSGGIFGGTIQGAVSVFGSNSGAPQSGMCILSGFNVFAGFQRPGRFVRANLVSGDFFAGTLNVGFVSQLKTTGSGGGFSSSPTGSGQNTINV